MKKFLFVIVCLMASFTFASCGGSTPAEEAANCIELLKNKDYDGYVETINFEGDTAEEIAQQKASFKELLTTKADEMYEEMGGIESYSLVSEEVAEDGNTAKVVYEITYGDGTKNNATINLINVDGEWKQEK